MTATKSKALATTKAGTPAKNLGGRPRVDIDMNEVRRLAALGLAADNIADRLGVSRKTLFNVMNRDPAIRDAMDQGLSAGIDFAASKLHDLISQGNLGAICFYLRTRSWIPPKSEVTVTVRNGDMNGPLTIDGHVSDIAEEHRRLLDGPNPDDWE
jgi:predicted DNA-binding protein (UPF0251 family)